MKTLYVRTVFFVRDTPRAMAFYIDSLGFKLDWVDGVDPDVIQEKAYPPGNHRQISRGNQGSWRAHMNALRE